MTQIASPFLHRYNSESLILLFALILAIGITMRDSTYIALFITVLLSIINYQYPRSYAQFIVILTPFTFLISVFLYNSRIFEAGFKPIVLIKYTVLLIIPLIIYLIKCFSKLQFSNIDFISFLYLLVNVLYSFAGKEYADSIQANFIQNISFLVLFYLGRCFYLTKLEHSRLINVFILTSLFITLVSFLMFIYADSLEYMLLSPKEYSVESIGMSELGFIGQFHLTCYSLLKYDDKGELLRLFGIFYSGIGMAYFTATSFFVSFANKKTYLIAFIFLAAIIMTMTRGVWILVIVAPILVLCMNDKNKILRRSSYLLLVLFSILVLLKYLSFIKMYFSGVTDVGSFPISQQSSAAHIFSVLAIIDVLLNKPFGYGVGYNISESIIVDIFARTGIIGITLLFLLFTSIFKTLKTGLFDFNHKLAMCFFMFALFGGIFSRETFTILDSYFVWIYIGFIYQLHIFQHNPAKRLL